VSGAQGRQHCGQSPAAWCGWGPALEAIIGRDIYRQITHSRGSGLYKTAHPIWGTL